MSVSAPNSPVRLPVNAHNTSWTGNNADWRIVASGKRYAWGQTAMLTREVSLDGHWQPLTPYIFCSVWRRSTRQDQSFQRSFWRFRRPGFNEPVKNKILEIKNQSWNLKPIRFQFVF